MKRHFLFLFIKLINNNNWELHSFYLLIHIFCFFFPSIVKDTVFKVKISCSFIDMIFLNIFWKLFILYYVLFERKRNFNKLNWTFLQLKHVLHQEEQPWDQENQPRNQRNQPFDPMEPNEHFKWIFTWF